MIRYTSLSDIIIKYNIYLYILCSIMYKTIKVKLYFIFWLVNLLVAFSNELNFSLLEIPISLTTKILVTKRQLTIL